LKPHSEQGRVALPRSPFSAVLLAVLLGVALLALGEKIYRDVREIPTRPNRVSIDRDPALASIDSARRATRDSVGVLTDSLRARGSRALEFEAKCRTAQEDYRTLLDYRSAHGVSDGRLSAADQLLERRARARLDSLRAIWDVALARQKALEAAADPVRVRLSALERRYGERRAELEREFAAMDRRYQGNVTLLRLLVVVPFLLLTVLLFQATRNRRPTYHIHATSGLVVSVILILHASAEYAWRAAHYYAALVLTALVLGLLLRAVMRQHHRSDRLFRLRVSQGACPACGLSLVGTAASVPTVTFCPRCGTRTREECASCGKPASASLPYCSECGMRRGDTPNAK